ncbi:MAG: YhcH/YjgK/YiaL family protein, partial [Anaerovibrio sp.]|nr:YhcH/YjgK/YiaL family protein [Anaerovibrio sp.]
PIDGKNSYAILQRYSTRLPESGKPEAHRQYVDIQYIVRGREELGWCPLNPELIEASPYDIEKDIVFYEKLVPGSSVVLDEGTFAVLYPADVHRPCGSVDGKLAPVTKVVVKIAVDYIK